MTDALNPDFAAVQDRRMSELTPAQFEDAKEAWLRDNLGWLGPQSEPHVTFLLRRLDEARALAKRAIAHASPAEIYAARRAEQAADIPPPRPSAYPNAIEGDVLPRVGDDVLIHLASSDQWVPHTVVGYYAWPSLEGNPRLQRVFVLVRDADGVPNARMLCDVLRLDRTPYLPVARTTSV